MKTMEIKNANDLKKLTIKEWTKLVLSVRQQSSDFVSQFELETECAGYHIFKILMFIDEDYTCYDYEMEKYAKNVDNSGKISEDGAKSFAKFIIKNNEIMDEIIQMVEDECLEDCFNKCL